MGRSLDYELARRVLSEEYERAEDAFRRGRSVPVPAEIYRATERVFSSATQAFREALVGCALARILDQAIDIRSPYVNQGENAFNGRTLDERVVNPFLHDRSIPCSKGPYLSAFRRNIRFEPGTARGLRDKEGYSAFLAFISHLKVADVDTSRTYLRHLLTAFIKLRESSDIPLAKIRRVSLEQYELLIAGLLSVPSGGLMPVLLSVATFEAVSRCFDLGWEIDRQGINVADKATGVGGDITVRRGRRLLLSVEVTERQIGRSRVVSTFTSKISPAGIEDYIFLFTGAEPTEDARGAARQYFAQGHEINFIPIRDWVLTVLGMVGSECRILFTNIFLDLLSRREVPASLKVAWNDQVQRLLSS